MRIATILPIPFMRLEMESDYHMCLAHLLCYPAYAMFFADQVDRGRFVLMDNGVVETGVAMPIDRLFTLAEALRPTQVCLPDAINDKRSTLTKFHLAARQWAGGFETMVIPQGETLVEWVRCAKTMLNEAGAAGVTAMGITKFLEGKVACRADAIEAVPGLVDSGLDLHLLGVMGDDPTEIHETDTRLPGRIRGCDSGVAAIYTQEGLTVGAAPRPRVELDFNPQPFGDARMRRLEKNIARWKSAAAAGAYE
jgi:hypothetical protein